MEKPTERLSDKPMKVDPEKIAELGLMILWQRIKIASSRRGTYAGRVALRRFRRMCLE